MAKFKQGHSTVCQIIKKGRFFTFTEWKTFCSWPKHTWNKWHTLSDQRTSRFKPQRGRFLAPGSYSLKTGQLDLCLNLIIFTIIHCSQSDVQITIQLGKRQVFRLSCLNYLQKYNWAWIYRPIKLDHVLRFPDSRIWNVSTKMHYSVPVYLNT